jgi:hypothetical protein
MSKSIKFRFYGESGAKNIKYKLPSGRVGIMHPIDKDGNHFVIAHNDARNMYFLYSIVDEKVSEVSKNKDPTQLEKIVFGV